MIWSKQVMTKEFYDKLQNARNAIYQMNNLQSQFIQQSNLLRKEEDELNRKKKCALKTFGWLLVIFFSLGGCFPLTNFVYLSIESKTHHQYIFLSILLTMCILFFSLYLLVKLAKFLVFTIHSKPVYKQKSLILNASINSITQSMVQLYNTDFKPALFIPPNYRYPLAIDYIIQCFVNGRADNLKEAVNLYEQQIHFWKVENYLEQLNQMQWQQNLALQNIEYMSKRAAYAAETSAVNSYRVY